MYTGTVRCYSTQLNVPLARSEARKTGTRTGLFLLHVVQRACAQARRFTLVIVHPVGKLLALTQVTGVR